MSLQDFYSSLVEYNNKLKEISIDNIDYNALNSAVLIFFEEINKKKLFRIWNILRKVILISSEFEAIKRLPTSTFSTRKKKVIKTNHKNIYLLSYNISW